MATASATYKMNSWLTYTTTIDYTIGTGTITINSIKGSHGYSSGDVYDATKNITHTISFPGGSGSIVTKSGSGSSGHGTGWKCNNGTWTWDISAGSTSFSSSGGTGNLQLTIGSDTVNYWPSGVTFDFGSITIPSPVSIPTLSAVTISNTTATGTSASFSVTNTGGASVTAQGCQFSATNFGTVVKSFTGTSGSVTGLSPNTTYYARAYATNSAGTGYSAVKSFTTLVGTPTLSAVTVSSVTTTGASASFSVTNTGGATITSNAIKASLTNFGTAVSTISSTSGSFSGLSPGTLYYVRAEASNGTNTGYSAVTSLSTSPTISINPASSSDGTTVTLNRNVGGNVSAYYYYLYDEYGTALVSNASNGSTVSGYTFSNDTVSGLTPGVKYGFAVRATYTAGTNYNSNGTTSSTVYVTTNQPTAISLSTNGSAFSPKPLYVSINGGAYKLVSSDKLHIL